MRLPIYLFCHSRISNEKRLRYAYLHSGDRSLYSCECSNENGINMHTKSLFSLHDLHRWMAGDYIIDNSELIV